MGLLKKLHKWVNDRYNDQGWGMLIINLIIVAIGYSLLNWSPEMHSWSTGKKISEFVTPQRHHWYMTVANVLVCIGLVAAGLRAIQLIKHRDWFEQQKNNKKLADERLDAEVLERKNERELKPLDDQ